MAVGSCWAALEPNAAVQYVASAQLRLQSTRRLNRLHAHIAAGVVEAVDLGG